jgi:hypothetical protein
MDRDDPYDRHYENLANEDYWRDRQDSIKQVYKPAVPSIEPTITPQRERNTELRQQREKAFDELLREKSNSMDLIYKMSSVTHSQRLGWWKELSLIDLIEGSGVSSKIESIRQQVLDSYKSLPYTAEDHAVVSQLLDSLSRMTSLYVNYKELTLRYLDSRR